MNVHDIGREFEKWVSDVLWKQMGISVVERYKNDLDQRKRGDFLIEFPNKKRVNVDVKAENNTPENFPIEIMQDWTSFDIGWFYTLSACNEIWYGRYEHGDIKTVYRIFLPRLRRVSPEISKEWIARNAKKNYGDTIIIAAPLKDLVNEKIAMIVYPEKTGDSVVKDLF